MPRWADVVPASSPPSAAAASWRENASFDCGRIAATHAHAGLDAAWLPQPRRWDCLMEALSTLLLPKTSSVLVGAVVRVGAMLYAILPGGALV